MSFAIANKKAQNLSFLWQKSYRADPEARALADRHYSRKKVGATQFVPPGRCLVLLTRCRRALWVTSWPFYVQHAWPGAWVCSTFRNEGAGRSSDLIREAVLHTVEYFGKPPLHGFVTFIDRRKVRPIMRRGVPTWGYSWKKAGWQHVGETKGGLMVWQMTPNAIRALVEGDAC